MPDISRGEPDPPPGMLRSEHRVEPGADPIGDLLDLDEPASRGPAPAGPGGSGKPAGAGASTGWHMAKVGGQPQGPFDLEEMRLRVRTGELRETDVVWREGMPEWVPARNVRELFGQTAEGPPPIPSVAGRAAAGPSAFDPDRLMRGLDAFFSRPIVYRIAGRASAVLAVATFMLSVMLSFFGPHWFTGAVLFAVVFVVCEAAGAILEHLQRSGERPDAGQAKSEKKETGGSLR